MRVSNRAGGAVVAAMLALLISLIGVPASADTCAVVACVEDATGFSYVGHISDPLRRPLDGARVSDGRQDVIADSNGDYRIDERQWNSVRDGYFASVSAGVVGRTEVRSKTARQGVGGEEVRTDFMLNYLLRGTTAPATSSLGPFAVRGSTVTYALTSAVPVPHSVCVPVKIRFNNQSLGDAALVGTADDGLSTWTVTFTVPESAPPAGFQLEAVAKDCATGIDLSLLAVTNVYVG